MRTITKPVYYCEYCKKHGLSKHKMEYHELICTNNPINKRPCFGCNNLGKKQIEITVGYQYNGDEIDRTVELFYCTKKRNIFTYTKK